MSKIKISYYYQYLFYKYYSWNFLSNDRNRYELGWAILSLAEYFNFLTILLIAQYFTGYGFIQFYELSKVQITLIWLIFLVFNYIVLINNKKYLKIVEKFEKESHRSKFIGNIFALLYFFGSCGLAGVTAYYVGIFQRAHG